MAGTIRALGKCPVCDKSFRFISLKEGFACTDHEFARDPRPERYVFDFFYGEERNRQRERLYRDHNGNVLECYSLAIKLQEEITTDMNTGRFRIEKYKGKDPKEYHLERRYEAWMKNYKNPSTLHDKKLSQKVIIKHFGPTRDIRTISTLDVDQFFKSMEEVGPVMRCKHMRNLVQSVEYYRTQDCPTISVALPPAFIKFEAELRKSSKKKAKNIPKLEEALMVINQLEPIERIASLTNGAHARRPGEIMALQAKHFNFTTGTFIIEQHIARGEMMPGTKTGEDMVPCNIHPALIEILREMCAKSNPDDYLFSADPSEPGNWRKLSDKIRAVARRFGLKSKPYQIVKHAFLSHVANKTKSLETGRALAQHASEQMERDHYCDMSGFDLEAQRAAQQHLDIPADVIPSKEELLKRVMEIHP